MSQRGIKRDSPVFEPQDGSDNESGRSSQKRVRSELASFTSRSPPASSLSAHSKSQSKLANGRVLLYDVQTQEQRPRLAIYSPKFSAAEKCITRIIKQFLATHDTIKSCGYDNDAVTRVCAELRRFLTPAAHYKTIGPVACLGPAGVGKSSTINSILSQEAAAPEHGGDERGTYVVHEYLGPLPTQVTPYLVEVPFRPRKTVASLVIRHQDSITKAQLPQEELDDDVEEDLEQKSRTGLEFFHNVLCNHADFRKLDDVVNYELDGEVALCPEKLAGVFSAFKTAIETFPAAQGMDLYAFFSIVDDIKAELMDDVEKHTDELQQIFVNVQSAITVDGKDNFVAEAMRDTYDACVLSSSESFGKPHVPVQSKRRRLFKQNTPHTRRVETIGKKLSGKGEESVFSTMYKKAERHLSFRLQGWENGMQEIMKAGCEKITQDFDERYQQQEEKEPEEQDPKAVEELQEAVKSALSLLNGELMGYIEDCEAYEKNAK